MKLVFDFSPDATQKAFASLRTPVASAASGAIKEAAKFIKLAGRASIASGGFGRRWQNALRVDVYPANGKASVDAAAFVYHKITYAHVFQYGKHIAGKPLLWIPLPSTPGKVGRKQVTPRALASRLGKLISFKSAAGRPLLGVKVSLKVGTKLSISKLKTGDKKGVPQLLPLFVGIPAAEIKQKFDVVGVCHKAQALLGAYYYNNLKV